MVVAVPVIVAPVPIMVVPATATSAAMSLMGESREQMQRFADSPCQQQREKLKECGELANLKGHIPTAW